MEYINRKKIIESYIISNIISNVIICPTLDFFLFNCLDIIHDIRTGINESNTG
jgi:hypothetical protein